MKISVIIPNFNGATLLESNLPKLISALGGFEKGEVEIIVVDDGSIDNSVQILTKFKDIIVLKNEKNKGFSYSVNHGASKASGELLLLINTDVYPEKGFIEPLVSHFNDPNVFAVGSMDKSIEGDKTTLRGRGVGHWERGFLVHARGDVDKSDTLWVSGGSGVFRKSMWEKLGGLNNIFNPFYWEDIDLSYRALKSGYKTVFENKSVVIHEHEKGVIKTKFSPFSVKTIVFRNQFIFVWTNLTDRGLIASHILWLPYHFIKTFISFDFAFFIGFIKAIILLPKIIKTRYNNKRLFRLSDKQVTNLYS